MKKGLSKIAMALFAAGLAFNVSAADIKVAVASDATSLDPQEQLSGQTLEMSHLVFDPDALHPGSAIRAASGREV